MSFVAVAIENLKNFINDFKDDSEFHSVVTQLENFYKQLDHLTYLKDIKKRGAYRTNLENEMIQFETDIQESVEVIRKNLLFIFKNSEAPEHSVESGEESEVSKEFVAHYDVTKKLCDLIYHLLIELAKEFPINAEDCLSLQPINDVNKFVISSGHQFDIMFLLDWYKSQSLQMKPPCDLEQYVNLNQATNPLSREKLHRRDCERLWQMVLDKKLCTALARVNVIHDVNPSDDSLVHGSTQQEFGRFQTVYPGEFVRQDSADSVPQNIIARPPTTNNFTFFYHTNNTQNHSHHTANQNANTLAPDSQNTAIGFIADQVPPPSTQSQRIGQPNYIRDRGQSRQNPQQFVLADRQPSSGSSFQQTSGDNAQAGGIDSPNRTI